jgi:hypothetical protein
MGTILYGLLIAHLLGYKEHYIKIGTTFALTFVTKRFVKSFGSKNDAEIIGLAGYTLTFGDFIKLISQVRSNATKAPSQETMDIVGGAVGKLMELIQGQNN